MQIDRLKPEYCKQGKHLHVYETTDDGYADLLLELPEGSLLLQYKSNLNFIFKNPKRADGIIFFPLETGVWGLLLVELKRSVKSAGKWQDIKQQWHGAWLHGLAIAGVLGIKLADRVEVMVAYRTHHMGSQMPDPILLKLNTQHATEAQAEWQTGEVVLPELGPVKLHRQALDPVTGQGCYAFK
jgi:hypothetical protein